MRIALAIARKILPKKKKISYDLPGIIAWVRKFMAVTRVGLYDIIALICLVLGLGMAIWAAMVALETAWLRTAVFAIVAVVLFHLSSLFAKLAIASSGRQR